MRRPLPITPSTAVQSTAPPFGVAARLFPAASATAPFSSAMCHTPTYPARDHTASGVLAGRSAAAAPYRKKIAVLPESCGTLTQISDVPSGSHTSTSCGSTLPSVSVKRKESAVQSS